MRLALIAIFYLDLQKIIFYYFRKQEMIKLINNTITTLYLTSQCPPGEIILPMFTFIGIFTCALDVTDIEIARKEMYLFCLGKCTQFNEMHHAMERTQNGYIYGFH